MEKIVITFQNNGNSHYDHSSLVTDEKYGYCDYEIVDHPSDHLWKCPECSYVNRPCSGCDDNAVDHVCGWTREEGCFRYPEPLAYQ